MPGSEELEEEKEASLFAASISLMRELLVRKIMPFTEVFQHYCSGIRSIRSYTYEEKKKLRQNFKTKVLSLEGLPVLILN